MLRHTGERAVINETESISRPKGMQGGKYENPWDQARGFRVGGVLRGRYRCDLHGPAVPIECGGGNLNRRHGHTTR